MPTKWTNEQINAITSRGNNILVSAAAGSGKTAVLVERVIEMISNEKEPLYINNLLIATYTNAAAGEMRERIYNALKIKISENPNSEYLKKQLILLNQAQISTIHAFCINLLRDNFNLLNIQHDFEIADDMKTSVLKKKAMDLLMDEMYTKSEPEFFEAVDSFGGKKSDEGLLNIILNLNRFTEGLAYPDEWLNNAINNGNSFENISRFAKEYVRDELENIINMYFIALDLIDTDEGLCPYADYFSDLYDRFNTIYENFDNYDFVKSVFDDFSFGSLPRKKKEADETAVSYVKGVRDYSKKQIDKLRIMYSYTEKDFDDEQKLMFPYVSTICFLVKRFREIYAELKRKENLMEFSDLEHFTIKLLDENEDIRKLLNEKYTEIFVDEYQDTNAVQSRLFELISNGKNLFMVGDVKQSIYAFRNSNPKFFIDKYRLYDESGIGEGKKITLSKNFRSSNGILRFVNNIFEKLMTEKLGGVLYNDDQRLFYGNESIKDIEKSYEIHIADSKFNDDSTLPDEMKMYDKVQLEAMMVAEKIIDIVKNEKPQIIDSETGEYRNVTYKDIAVLMRNTKNTSSVFADIFASFGIPVYAEETGKYLNNIEIATVISFLKIIDNPLQNVPMLAVLRSPVYNFSDELIAKIRSENKYVSLYDNLKNSGDEKAVNFISDLSELIEFSKYNDVLKVIKKIIYDKGYYTFVGGLADGERRMMNLRLLCERADLFMKRGFKSTSQYVRFIENMVYYNNEYTCAKSISGNDNVVKIMTIHKSKGLEFPVVFLSGCSTKFNTDDIKKPCIYDENFGIFTNIIYKERNLKYVPHSKSFAAQKKKRDICSEEVRLLYVALTRAKYKLIITASMSDAYKKVSKYKDDIFTDKDKYIDWILPACSSVVVPKLHSAEDIVNNLHVCSGGVKHIGNNEDYSDMYDDIDEILSFNYGYGNVKAIPSKLAISDIVSLNDDEIYLQKISDKKNSVTNAQRGTLIHFILQNIDLSRVGTKEDINSQIDMMCVKGMFDASYKEFIDADAIYGFFKSSIGERMLKSESVYREFKFCVDVPSFEVGFDSDEETVLIQGVIDCCFIEDGDFVIIDYKTGSMQEKYKEQLRFYKTCLKIATGKNVKETFIYPLI